ncbi:hypothetical protein AUJ68_01490 [Candidatus Woesearchaeota archaeon CG1_02_57_44]|nr:MAG: hypothetical protein AUJ68_01490 [Candidatus Woesearchaeota archaeon CG1_02_57_44]
MRKEIDKQGRTLYIFHRGVAQGGNVYVHKTKGESIKERDRLRNALNKQAAELDLIDTTIKVYNTIIFIFFHMPKKLSQLELENSIQETIKPFGNWDEENAFMAIYDPQERFIRKDLERWGCNYDDG